MTPLVAHDVAELETMLEAVTAMYVKYDTGSDRQENLRSLARAIAHVKNGHRLTVPFAAGRGGNADGAVAIVGAERELVDVALRPGERVVNGVRLYSAAWIDDNEPTPPVVVPVAKPELDDYAGFAR